MYGQAPSSGKKIKRSLTVDLKSSFPGGTVVKNLPVNAGDVASFDPWVEKIP